MVTIVKRVVGALLALAGLALTVVGVWFATQLGTSGTAEFTVRPATTDPVRRPARRAQPGRRGRRRHGDPGRRRRRCGWRWPTPPTRPRCSVSARHVEVTGVSVRDWALLTRTTRHRCGARARRRRPVAPAGRRRRARSPSRCSRTRRPRRSSSRPRVAPLESLTLTVTDKTWFVEAVVAALVGLFLLVVGVVLLVAPSPPPPRPTSPAGPTPPRRDPAPRRAAGRRGRPSDAARPPRPRGGHPMTPRPVPPPRPARTDRDRRAALRSVAARRARSPRRRPRAERLRRPRTPSSACTPRRPSRPPSAPLDAEGATAVATRLLAAADAPAEGDAEAAAKARAAVLTGDALTVANAQAAAHGGLPGRPRRSSPPQPRADGRRPVAGARLAARHPRGDPRRRRRTPSSSTSWSPRSRTSRSASRRACRCSAAPSCRRSATATTGAPLLDTAAAERPGRLARRRRSRPTRPPSRSPRARPPTPCRPTTRSPTGLRTTAAAQAKALGKLGTLTQKHEPLLEHAVTFRLADGGAVTFGLMRRTDTIVRQAHRQGARPPRGVREGHRQEEGRRSRSS